MAGSGIRPVRPWRRIMQLLVLATLVAIPLLASVPPGDWSPSRLAQGQLPPPSLTQVTGDTWCLQVGNLTLAHPLAFLEVVLASKTVLLSFLFATLLPLLISVLLGRVFCSWLCPVGFCLELVQQQGKKADWSVARRQSLLPDRRIAFFVLLSALSLLLSTPFLSHIDPPHLLGRELMYARSLAAVSATGLGLLLGMLLLDLLVSSRAWCNSLCPSGGGLSLLGGWRRLNIRMDAPKCTRCGDCDQACPYYLQPMQLADDGEFNWLKCDNCGLCRDVCPEGAIKFSLRRKE